MKNNNENTDQTKPSSPEKKPRASRRKKLKRVLLYTLAGLVFLFLVIIPLLLNIYADRIIGETARQVVQSKTHGQYALSYSEINFHALRREIIIEDLLLVPDTAYRGEAGSADTTITHLHVPYLHIKGVGVLQALWNRELVVEDVMITAPSFELVTNSSDFAESDDSESSAPRSNPIRHLYRLVEDYLDLLRVEKFNLENASFKILHTRGETRDTIDVENVSIQIHNFILDDQAHANKERLFFSDSITLRLEDGMFSYRTNLHQIEFQELEISSVTGDVSIEELHIRRDTTTVGADGQSWMDLNIPRVTLKGFHFNVVPGEALFLNEIVIRQPDIIFYPAPGQVGKSINRDTLTENLYQQITTYFKPLEVMRVHIDKGRLRLPSHLAGSRAPILVPQFSLTLHHLLMDSASYAERSHFFFIDDLELTTSDQSLTLAESNLKISFANFTFDTRTNLLTIDSLFASHPKEYGTGAFDLQLPHLAIESHDLKSDFIHRWLSLKEILLQQPGLKMLAGSAKAAATDINIYHLFPVIKPYFNFIEADVLKITDADIEHIDWTGKVEKISAAPAQLTMTGFRLDEKAHLRPQIFYSECIRVELEQLLITLPGINQRLRVQNASLDTRNKIAQMTGIVFDTLHQIPPLPVSPLMILLSGRDMSLMGTDFLSLYRGDGLYADSLMIVEPALEILGEPMGTPTADTTKMAYIDFLIHKIQITKGEFGYKRNTASANTVTAKSFDLYIDDFRPGNNDTLQPFDAAAVVADVRNLTVVLPDSLHLFRLGTLHLSSMDSLLTTTDISLQPKTLMDIRYNDIFQIDVSDAEIDGLELMKLYHRQELAALSATINNPNIRLITPEKHQQQLKTFKDFRPEIIKKQILSVFSSVNLGSINILHAAMEIFGGTLMNSRDIKISDARVAIRDFIITPKTGLRSDNLFYAADVMLAVDGDFRIYTDKNKRLIGSKLLISTADQSLDIGSFIYSIYNDADLNFGSLQVSGLSYYDLMVKKTFQARDIRIENPDLYLDLPAPGDTSMKLHRDSLQLYKHIRDHLYSAAVDNIQVNDARLKIRNPQQDNRATFDFKKINLDFTQLSIDSETRAFDNKFLYFDDMKITLRDFQELTSDSLYNYGAAVVSYSTRHQQLMVDSGYLQPTLPDTLFAAKVGVQADRLQMVFDKLELTDFDITQFIFDNTLRIGKAELTELVGDDYRSKSYPLPENHFPKLPVTALQDLEIKLLIDNFIVNNSCFTYREYMPPARQPGVIFLNDINVLAQNISNMPEVIAHDSVMSVYAAVLLMNEGKVALNLEFNLSAENDLWSATGEIGSFDLTKLNPLLEHIAFVKVKKGFNELVKFHFTADDELAKGDIKFRYNKLQIRLISKETFTDDSFEESLISFIANTFVVRRGNPQKLFSFRDGEMYFRRDVNRSFFNYLVKTTLSGVMNTIRGGSEERKEKKQKERLEKQLIREGKLDKKALKELQTRD
ncbi:MAG TPA: hypothetical protein VFC92_10920 [Bacteroidales bacterium]|nr:hypothetical protein [Bacteroidales bacterium]